MKVKEEVWNKEKEKEKRWKLKWGKSKIYEMKFSWWFYFKYMKIVVVEYFKWN